MREIERAGGEEGPKVDFIHDTVVILSRSRNFKRALRKITPVGFFGCSVSFERGKWKFHVMPSVRHGNLEFLHVTRVPRKNYDGSFYDLHVNKDHYDFEHRGQENDKPYGIEEFFGLPPTSGRAPTRSAQK